MSAQTMSKRTKPSAVEIIWLLISCSCLAFVLWYFPKYLFVVGTSPMPAARDSARDLSEPSVPQGNSGLWGNIHREPSGPRKIASEANAGDSLHELPEPPPASAAPRPTRPRRQERTAPAEPLPPQLRVAFKVDRGSGGRRMRPVWSPLRTYSRAQIGNQVIVEAKAQVSNTNGRMIDVDPEWIPTDPGMISVSRARNSSKAVVITVRHSGQSSLRVASQGISKELIINASDEDRGLRVDIVQQLN